MDSSMALMLEKAKEEYVNAINKVTEKYKLSYYFVDLVLGAIYGQVNQLKQQELIAERTKQEKIENKDKKGGGK